ncbi:hypothetical protein EIP75_22130 [Aquabacterium soli]|uniref:Uncharacterized protein n=1 Tax=Aquabacterium soli TaxID=2493092 RepID=A0A3R8T8P2_9BURK|nr:hypothetical protein [Aquabacterium soli]RRS01093.1 hypothetical protein EIP75_22130 [Aquabacterium soli]
MSSSSNPPLFDQDGDPIDPALHRLVATHPVLFRGRLPAVASYVPAGWYPLVDELCRSIEAELGPQGCEKIEVRQIKEKFAGLRFYLVERSLADVKSLPVEDAMDRVHALIRTACEQSERTCQKCGAPCVVHDVGGYLAALCDTHLRG